MLFRQGCCSYPIPSRTWALGCRSAAGAASCHTAHDPAGPLLQLLIILLAEDSGFGTSVPPKYLFLWQSACTKALMILTTTDSLQTDSSCAHISGLPKPFQRHSLLLNNLILGTSIIPVPAVSLLQQFC